MSNLRQFGIEMECFHPVNGMSQSRANICAGLGAMGYRAAPAQYTGTDYSLWQIKPDVSLRPAGYALECVAPTLPGNQRSIEQITKVADWLNANGFDVNASCGLHIHLDASDMTLDECAAVSARYHHRQHEIDDVMAPSRRGGQWAERLTGGNLTKVLRAVTGQRSIWTHGERRVAVNLEHVHKGRAQKRLEFRQHSGTLNAGKIVGWYLFLCDFVAETLRLVRNAPAVDWSATPNRDLHPVAAPIIRRQRIRRPVRTRSVVTGTTAAPRIPTIDPGTDYDLFLNAIAQRGVCTLQDGRTFGWPDTRLRVTAHWLRRHGADLLTTERNGELAYVARGGATTRDAIFTAPAQIRRRVHVSTALPSGHQPTTPAPSTTETQAMLARLADTPVLSGVSETTKTWFEKRRAQIAAAGGRRTP